MFICLSRIYVLIQSMKRIDIHPKKICFILPKDMVVYSRILFGYNIPKVIVRERFLYRNHLVILSIFLNGRKDRGSAPSVSTIDFTECSLSLKKVGAYYHHYRYIYIYIYIYIFVLILIEHLDII